MWSGKAQLFQSSASTSPANMIVPPVRNSIRFQPFGIALFLALVLAVQIWALPIADAARFAVIAALIGGIVLASIGTLLRLRATALTTRRVGVALLLAGIAILVVAIVIDVSAARSFIGIRSG
jgi:hypothetical protein